MKYAVPLSFMTAITLLAGSIDIKSMPSDPKRVYPTNDRVVLSYNHSIKDVIGSVVNISTTKTIEQRGHQHNPMMNHPFFRDFFGHSFPNVPQKRQAHSLGSGVIISKDGYIVTNNHVVQNADEIIVTFADKDKEYKAEIIGLDPKTDLAVIKIETTNLKPVKFGDSENLKEGDLVFALGNPFGVGSSVTKGIISALNKTSIGLNRFENFIQTDASINPGNSGGALVDSRGALIGINSAILTRSGGADGIGFAIPSNMVRHIAVSLIEDGRIDRGYIGVSISNLTSDLREVYKSQSGALVLNVEKGSPASKGGLKLGDLIIKIDDKTIKSANDLKNNIGRKVPGTTIEVKFERNRKIHNIKIVLANMDRSLDPTTKIEYIEGLSMKELNDMIRAKQKIPSHIDGIFVSGVKSGSHAHKLGFMPGDIIVQVDQIIIEDFDDMKKALKKEGKKVIFINRNGFHKPIVIK